MTLTKRRYEQLLARAAKEYRTNHPDYDATMADLVHGCSPEQWEDLERRFDDLIQEARAEDELVAVFGPATGEE